jgi:hypothetical protein
VTIKTGDMYKVLADMDNMPLRDASIDGYFLSPYEPRALVVVREQQHSQEATYRMVGAHLAVGFRDAKLEARILELLAAVRRGDTAALRKFIHPKLGLYHVVNPGAATIIWADTDAESEFSFGYEDRLRELFLDIIPAKPVLSYTRTLPDFNCGDEAWDKPSGVYVALDALHARKGEVEKVWDLYSTVDRWPEWDTDMQKVVLEGDFVTGTNGVMFMKEMPPLPFVLDDVQKGEYFINTSVLGEITVTFGHYISEERV